LPVIASEYPVISGFVVDQLNQPMQGVLIQTNLGPSTSTDSTGFYQFTGLESGVYILTAVKEGYVFAPVSRTATIPGGAILQNFVGEQLPPTATPTATNTPTATYTPTITPTPSNTPTATNTPAITCSNLIVNGGFENNSGWYLPITEYSAGYSTYKMHSGSRSLRTGIVNPSHNTESSSSGMQQVTIPAGATQATLEFWIYTKSSSPPFLNVLDLDEDYSPLSASIDEDAQVVLILDTGLNELGRLYGARLNDQTWKFESHDLLSFKGQTFLVYFGSNNNGVGGVTAMYVDDVRLDVCGPTS
jgi:hypothetical protein